MPTNETELLRAARSIARLQTQCRKLRRQLKLAKANLRLERKHLKALGGLAGERRPDVVPSRVFGDGVGYVAPETPAAPKSAASPATDAFIEGLMPLRIEEDR